MNTFSGSDWIVLWHVLYNFIICVSGPQAQCEVLLDCWYFVLNTNDLTW